MDCLGEVDWRRGTDGFAADRELAHLALDPAGIAAVSAGDDALLQDFGDYRVMECGALLRGEKR
jgi:hypothetical protein